jgi:hypothetical protein
MRDWEIIEKVTDAFGASTKNDNAFRRVLESIKWDTTFEADGEHYFIAESGLTLTTPSLDPFKVTRQWPAEFQLSDMSAIVDVFGNRTETGM